MIDPLRIVFAAGSQLIVGGFGDVQKATLTSPDSSPVIAVKRLRPQGNWEQRVRVAAVCDLEEPSPLAALDR